MNEQYKIRIDKQNYDVNVPSMTGNELLTLAGKALDRFKLIQRLKGGQAKPVGANESISFTDPGVERFMTLPLDQTEGNQCAATSICRQTTSSSSRQRS